jgi:putative peptidoglycan lipid II flippase
MVVLVLTQLMNAVFVPLIGFAGLAWSVSLGAVINAGWLYAGLRRLGAYMPEPGWLGFFLRVLVATGLLGTVLYVAERRIDWVGLVDHQAQRIGWLVLCLGGAALLYFGTLLAFGIRLRQFMRRG